MPAAACQIQRVCGQFLPVFVHFMYKRACQKIAMRIATVTLRCKIDGVLLGVLLSYLFWGSILLQCNDIELNPGPPKPTPPDQSSSKKDMRQTRLSSVCSSAGPSRSSATDRSADSGSASSPPVTEHTMTDVVSMLKAFGEQMQTMNSQMNAMNEKMDTKLDDLKKQVQDLRQDNAALQGELSAARNEMTELKKDNATLQKKNSDLHTRLEECEDRIDDLEGHSKRNNLIFYGLHRRQDETSADCEGVLRDFLTDQLDIADDVMFDRVHRLSGKSDSPVIARFTYYNQKMKILKQKSKLRGTNIFIGEDFSRKVRDIRRRLTPHLKKARQDGKRATMVYNHLRIDGTKYSVDGTDKLVEMK